MARKSKSQTPAEAIAEDSAPIAENPPKRRGRPPGGERSPKSFRLEQASAGDDKVTYWHSAADLLFQSVKEAQAYVTDRGLVGPFRVVDVRAIFRAQQQTMVTILPPDNESAA